MNKKELIYLLKDYSAMDNATLIDLKDGIDKYPYSSVLQLLYLLNLKYLGDDTFDFKLPFVAVCVGDRGRLKQQVDKLDAFLAAAAEAKKAAQAVEEPVEVPASAETTSSEEKTISQWLPKRANVVVEETSASEPTPEVKAEPKRSVTEESRQQEVLEKVSQQIDSAKEAMAVVETAGKFQRNTISSQINKWRKQTAKEQKQQKSVVGVEPPKTSRKKASVDKKRHDKEELVDKFLQAPASVERPDEETDFHKLEQEIEKNSLRENSEMVSETLAFLYQKQGLVNQAIEIYEQLSLKFPEKNRYFAKLIKEAKKNK